MTYMSILNCALKLVEEIILYYDARSKKHKKKQMLSYEFVAENFTVYNSYEGEQKITALLI